MGLGSTLMGMGSVLVRLGSILAGLGSALTELGFTLTGLGSAALVISWTSKTIRKTGHLRPSEDEFRALAAQVYF